MKNLNTLINDRNELERKLHRLEFTLRETTNEMLTLKENIASLDTAINNMTETTKSFDDYKKIFSEVPEMYYEIASHIVWEELIDIDGYKITEMCWFNECFNDIEPLELIDKLDKNFNSCDNYYYRDENGYIHSCDDYSPLNAIMDKIIEYLLTNEHDEYIKMYLSGRGIW